MERKLVFYPDPLLKQIAEPIVGEFGTEWLIELVQDMEHIASTKKGVGLAAVQIGVNKAVVIYEDRKGQTNALCNPEIIARSGKIKSYNEGCLSVPGFTADIKRSKEVKIKGQKINGERIILKARGFQSIILQHEIDHLKGIEFIDRVSNSNKEKQQYLKSLTAE